MKLSLKAARTQAGFSQEDIAKMLNVSTSTVSNWEKGVVDITARNLYKLSDIYKMSISDFLLPIQSS